MEFSVDIIELVKYLKSNKESIISSQIGRSGTSIGANMEQLRFMRIGWYKAWIGPQRILPVLL